MHEAGSAAHSDSSSDDEDDSSDDESDDDRPAGQGHSQTHRFDRGNNNEVDYGSDDRFVEANVQSVQDIAGGGTSSSFSSSRSANDIHRPSAADSDEEAVQLALLESFSTQPAVSTLSSQTMASSPDGDGLEVE